MLLTKINEKKDLVITLACTAVFDDKITEYVIRNTCFIQRMVRHVC